MPCVAQFWLPASLGLLPDAVYVRKMVQIPAEHTGQSENLNQKQQYHVS